MLNGEFFGFLKELCFVFIHNAKNDNTVDFDLGMCMYAEYVYICNMTYESGI